MTKIEWTDRTWNPVTGCNKVSQGCKNCYAEVMHRRLRGMFPEKYSRPFLDGAEMHVDVLEDPLRWKKPAMVFVNSMSDLFHPNVDFFFISKVFEVMSLAHWHTFQVLTKRPDRALEFFNCIQNLRPRRLPVWPVPNVWIGVSCENQETAEERIPLLLEIPAAIRFLSCEPLLGPVEINPAQKDPCIHWVIAGGESGHRARPCHPEWIRSLRDQCATASVPFFFKQWGEWAPSPHIRPFDSSAPNNIYEFYKVGKKHSGARLDGREHREFPVRKEAVHA